MQKYKGQTNKKTFKDLYHISISIILYVQSAEYNSEIFREFQRDSRFWKGKTNHEL